MESNELIQFRQAATEHNVCEEYSAQWDKCRSNRALVELACTSVGIDYLCRAAVEGWGMSADYIAERFKHLINGKYLSEQKGYTSRIFAKYNRDYKVDCTQTLFLSCDCTINVSPNCVCKLFLVNSNVTILGGGICYVYSYGGSKVTKGDDETTIRFK